MGSVPSSPLTADPRLAVADAELRTPHQQRVFERHRLHEEAFGNEKSRRHRPCSASFSGGSAGVATPTALADSPVSHSGTALFGDTGVREKDANPQKEGVTSVCSQARPQAPVPGQTEPDRDPQSLFVAHGATSIDAGGHVSARISTRDHSSSGACPHHSGESLDPAGNRLTSEESSSLEPPAEDSVLACPQASCQEGEHSRLLAVSTSPGFPQPFWRRADHDEVGGFRESDVLGRILTTRTISSFFRSVDSGESTASEYGVCSTTPSMSPAFATPSRQRSALRQEDSAEPIWGRKGPEADSTAMEPRPLSPPSLPQEASRFQGRRERGSVAEASAPSLSGSPRLASYDREKNARASKEGGGGWLSRGEAAEPESDRGRSVSPHHCQQRSAEKEDREKRTEDELQYDRGLAPGAGEVSAVSRNADRDTLSNCIPGDESRGQQRSGPLHGSTSDISQSPKESSNDTTSTDTRRSSSSVGATAQTSARSSSLSWMDQIRHALSQTAFLGPLGTADGADVESEEDEEEHEEEPEDLDDSELLLLQGVHVYRAPPETLANAPHGSEPCNVLVCVEPENSGGDASSISGGGGGGSSQDGSTPATSSSCRNKSSSGGASSSNLSFFAEGSHQVEKSKDDGSTRAIESLEPIVFLPNDPLAHPANPPPLPELPLHGVVLFGADGSRTSYCRIRKDRHITTGHDGSRLEKELQDRAADGRTAGLQTHTVDESCTGRSSVEAQRDFSKTPGLPVMFRSNSALAALGGTMKRGGKSTAFPQAQHIDARLEVMSPVKEGDESVEDRFTPSEEDGRQREHEPLSPSDSQFLELSEGDRIVAEKLPQGQRKDEESYNRLMTASRTGLSVRVKDGDNNAGKGVSSSKNATTHPSSSGHLLRDTDGTPHRGGHKVVERCPTLQSPGKEVDGGLFQKDKSGALTSELGENLDATEDSGKHSTGTGLSAYAASTPAAPSSPVSTSSLATPSTSTTASSTLSPDPSLQSAGEPRNHLSNLGQLVSRTSGMVVARGARSWAHTQYANFQQRTVNTLRLQRKKTVDSSSNSSSGAHDAGHANRSGGKGSSGGEELGGRHSQGQAQGQSWWSELQRSVTDFFGPQAPSVPSAETSVSDEQKKTRTFVLQAKALTKLCTVLIP